MTARLREQHAGPLEGDGSGEVAGDSKPHTRPGLGRSAGIGEALLEKGEQFTAESGSVLGRRGTDERSPEYRHAVAPRRYGAHAITPAVER